MKILFVANYNPGHFAPFVVEQMESLRELGCEVDTFGIVGKGPIGYVKNLPALRKKIRTFRPDIVHAHYGLSGLLSVLQRMVPTVITFHGSDIHSGGYILKLSQIAMKSAAYNIFVSNGLYQQAHCNMVNAAVVPCGVNVTRFYPMDKQEARKALGWDVNKQCVLFAGAFSRDVKNPELAKAAMERLPHATLVEFNGFNRQEVMLALNACDCLLMTSYNEGSPQIIKEAMACATPIVSVNVGDVKEVLDTTQGCYIAERNPDAIAEKLQSALSFQGETNGYQQIISRKLTNDLIAQRLISIYTCVKDESLKDGSISHHPDSHRNN